MTQPPPIEDYAFLSDCQAPALVSRGGSVDWWCPPRVDAPPVFGRLLDPRGGYWLLEMEGEVSRQRRYLPETLVLETTVVTTTGEAVVREALAMEQGARNHDVGVRSPHVLVRTVVARQGRVTLRTELAPRFEYGITTPHLRPTDQGLVAEAGPERLWVGWPVTPELGEGVASARLTVPAGTGVGFWVAHGIRPPRRFDAAAAVDDTERAWTSWAEAHRGYEGRYAHLARASGVVLHGLTYQPTGAVMAAATTSLPAAPGGEANWDYRYAWLRDLSVTGEALWVAACPDEASRYLDFLAQAAGDPRGTSRVQIVYGVDGRRFLPEVTLDHLTGYRGSRPVRIGNAAWDQAQLDVMGEVLDLAHRFADQLDPMDERVREMLVWMADEAASSWRSPDSGMWEARDRERHYLTSKVMCWVALDRAVRLAPLLGRVPDAWAAEREQIRGTVLERGWNAEVGAFTGAFGSDRLDASVLMMPLVGFLAATDDRMRATIGAVERSLLHDGLVYRWAGDTNGFVLSTYWLVECLALLGDTARAVALFEQVTARANDLGLFAEQIDGTTGAHTGNFPQAFSHVGLVNAAWRLANTSPE